MEDLIVFFRDLLLLKLAPDRSAATERIVDAERFRSTAEGFAAERLFRMIDMLNRYQNEMRFAAQPQTMFEVALLKICTLPDELGAAGVRSLPKRRAPAAREPRTRRSAPAAQRVELLEAAHRAAAPLRRRRCRGSAAPGEAGRGAGGGRPAGGLRRAAVARRPARSAA